MMNEQINELLLIFFQKIIFFSSEVGTHAIADDAYSFGKLLSGK